MDVRTRTEEIERLTLAPWATFSDASRGRQRPEEQDPIRPVFQRDRDRVLHCKAFRRLKQKTQVFLSPEGDLYRTRLTHTLEVAQIARTIARALRLNEDLTEAISLAHDLGHTPFGHAGESALDKLCPDGFKHYRQSLRVVDNVPGAREKADRGELLFGTVETWLIWQLTGSHVTDYSNASRTMLFDIHRLCWDAELCELLGIPMSILPLPVANSQVYGLVKKGIPGLEKLAGVPVCGAAGDQQAALFGQTCFRPGEAKNTYGTGCFTLMNVGEKPVRSRAGLVTSVAWQVEGRTAYALEGSVFNGGSTIQWLRDELHLIDSAPECDRLAESVEDSGGVVVVPAFTGLGAPYWDMYARGAILGVTRGTGRAHIARAVLECIAYQVTDLMLAMRQDAGCDITALRVDGGASVSDILMQLQADLLRIPVDRPRMVETTAFGAAALAGLSCGVWSDLEELTRLRRSQRVFEPLRPQADCDRDYRLWKRAVSRASDWIEH